MKTILETAARKAGATEVIYDREAMQNILLDEKRRGDVICLIDEFDESQFVVNSNGVDELHTIRIAFVSQVNFEETAKMNEATLKSLKQNCKSFVVQLVRSGFFRDLKTVPIRKYQEPRSDFNAIGYEMTFNITETEGYAEC